MPTLELRKLANSPCGFPKALGNTPRQFPRTPQPGVPDPKPYKRSRNRSGACHTVPFCGRACIWRPSTERAGLGWAGLGWLAGLAGWAGCTKGSAAACRNLPCPSAAARELWGRSQTSPPSRYRSPRPRGQPPRSGPGPGAGHHLRLGGLRNMIATMSGPVDDPHDL